MSLKNETGCISWVILDCVGTEISSLYFHRASQQSIPPSLFPFGCFVFWSYHRNDALFQYQYSYTTLFVHTTRYTPHTTRHIPHTSHHNIPHATRHTPHTIHHTPHTTHHTLHTTHHSPHTTHHTPHHKLYQRLVLWII